MPVMGGSYSSRAGNDSTDVRPGLYKDDRYIIRPEEWGQQKREKFYKWFKNNDIYKCGILVIKGRSDIKIGEYVYRVSLGEPNPVIDELFYVEGVTHEYRAGETYVTTLLVTRGQPLNRTNRIMQGFERLEKKK